MVKNFKIIIEYDGTHYHGWQRQKEEPTIQGEIEKALLTITAKNVIVNGSGRTDAGVHAYGQVANFRCDTKLAPEILQKGLNSLLPDDIVIKACCQAASNFHARYDVKSKIYHYKIFNQPIPPAIHHQYVWFIRKRLNIHAMQVAIRHIIGSHNFKAFEGSGSPRAHTIRHVIAAEMLETESGQIRFQIEADGFLRYMVRNIVGTLVDVGLSKLSTDDFKQILDSSDRTNASATAPAHGLYLMEVKY